MSSRHSIALLMHIGVVLVLWLSAGCGGSEGGGGQQAEEAAEQASEQPTQEATQEELVPVSVSKVPADRMYAGRVQGSDAFIGFALREQTNELIAYVCDGPPEGPPEATTIDAWFQGPIEADGAPLTAADGGQERVQASVIPEAIFGTFIDSDTHTYEFVAMRVDVEGDAGLYWSEPAQEQSLGSRVGTIVSADGEERGKRRP